MIYEYAVDPTILAKKEIIPFILASFGLDNGRFISDTNNGQWVKWVRAEINEKAKNQPVLKKRLEEALAKITKKQKAIYKRNNIPADNWEDLIEKTHISCPYRGILIENPPENNDSDYLSYEDFDLVSHPKWQAPPSLTVQRTAQSMLEPAISLLNLSREVTLVDRNFRFENARGRPDQRFLNFLLCVVNCIDEKNKKGLGPKVKTVFYYIGDEYHTKNHLEYLKSKYLSPKLPSEMDVKYVICSKKNLHDRYILSDVGVLEYGYGLDESTTFEQTVTVKRLGRHEHHSLRDKLRKELADS